MVRSSAMKTDTVFFSLLAVLWVILIYPIMLFPALAKEEVIVSGITFPNTITDDQWKVFTSNLDQYADPPLTLKMMIRGEIGSEENMVSALRRGRVQVAAPSTAGTSSILPELAVIQLPYLFESAGQMDFILDRVLPDPLDSLMRDKGLVFLHWIDAGWVSIYAKDLLTEPDHVTGYKMRTPYSPAAQIMATVLKADVIYMSYPEIIPALQTGLIDGGITSDYGFVTGGLEQEVNYFILTQHTYDTGLMIANKTWFESMSTKNRSLLRSAYGDISSFRQRSRNYTASELARLPFRSAVEVVKLTDDQRKRWVIATRPTHRRLLDSLGSIAVELYEVVEEGKRRYANGLTN